MHDLSGREAAIVRRQPDGGAAHGLQRRVRPQGGVGFRMAIGRARPADGGTRQRLHRAGRDGIDAHLLGAKVIGQITDRGFQRRLGHAHHVVIGRDAVRSAIGQRDQRATIGHQFRRAAADIDEGKAGNRQRIGEIPPRRVDEASRQLVLVGIGDGMDEEIDRPPAVLQRGKAGVERGVVGHIHIDHEIGPDRCGEGLEALAERLSLIREGKLRPFGRHGPRDAPPDRAFVGHAHDKPALALHQFRHPCPLRSGRLHHTGPVRPDTCSSPRSRWYRRSRSCWTGRRRSRHSRAGWSRFPPDRARGRAS
ncbi:MAG: hypothetical protein RIR62_17 [Pseudomonadota bacterium]